MSNFDFSNACVSFNSDPYIAKNEAEVREREDFLNQDGIEVEEITPENGEDFTDVCKRLDTDLATAEVRRVYKACKYNEEPMYFCLDSDWDFKS